MSPRSNGNRARRVLAAVARVVVQGMQTMGCIYAGQVFPHGGAGEPAGQRPSRLTPTELRLWEELVEKLR